MPAYFKVMHSTPARLIRLFGGLWLVIYAKARYCQKNFPRQWGIFGTCEARAPNAAPRFSGYLWSGPR